MAIDQRADGGTPVLGRPFVRFVHVIAWVFLFGAGIELLAYQAIFPASQLWSAVVPVAVMAALLFALDTHESFLRAAVYIVAGSAAVYATAILLFPLGGITSSTDAVPLTMMKIALIMVGGSSASTWRVLAWSFVGFVAGELATFAAALQAHAQIVPDASTIAVIATLGLILTVIGLTRARRSRARPALDQAARDEEASEIRYRIEVRAAALMHDTILSHLNAIAHSDSGSLPRELRREVENDLAVLLGEEWLSEPSPEVDNALRTNWRRSALLAAVQEVRETGLDVEVTGDLAAVGRFTRERDTAVGLAVKQCLVNVINHAQVRQAEVVIVGAPREISVMVIDAGRGFAEASIGIDRLGIRQSVRRRIEDVGGAVQIWSTPGRGTSVMIRVPASELVLESEIEGSPDD